MSRSTRRAADFVVYVAIALAVGGGVVWYANASGPNGADLFGRWAGLAVNTAILFGYLLKDSRRFWHSRRLWVLLVLMLSAHLVIFSLILLRSTEWKIAWFLVMYPVEVPIFFLLRGRIVDFASTGIRARNR